MSLCACFDCGKTFDSADLKAVQEDRGEFWGAPAFETMYYCPHCGSDQFDDVKNIDRKEFKCWTGMNLDVYEDEDEEEED